MNYCNKCGKEIINSGHICNDFYKPNDITLKAMDEAMSMTHDAVLGEVLKIIESLKYEIVSIGKESNELKFNQMIGHNSALNKLREKLSEHFA